MELSGALKSQQQEGPLGNMVITSFQRNGRCFADRLKVLLKGNFINQDNVRMKSIKRPWRSC